MKQPMFKTALLSSLMLAGLGFASVGHAFSGSLGSTTTENLDIWHATCTAGASLTATVAGTPTTTSGTRVSVGNLDGKNSSTSCTVTSAAGCTTAAVAANNAGNPNTFVLTVAQTTAAAHAYTVTPNCSSGAASSITQIINR
ncbi:hypothetical protein ACH518_17585 [Methylomonas sp. HW2-6]|uniref:hypothetical protein n=1 Tax=Methylomonas TaxID=416 RepID=UPI001128C9A3|nr:hypothetical protein [Methylomonas koyamae]